MDYPTLVQALQDYLSTDQPTFVANISNFVRTAETRIYRESSTPDSRTETSGTVATQTFLTPAEFIRSLYLTIDGLGEVLPKDDSFIRAVYTAGATGNPRYYSITYSPPATGSPSTIKLGPAPSVSMSYTLAYVQLYSIVDNVNTWLGDHCPDVLLNEAIVNAYTFLKGDADLLAAYKDTAKESRAQLARMAPMVRTDEIR